MTPALTVETVTAEIGELTAQRDLKIESANALRIELADAAAESEPTATLAAKQVAADKELAALDAQITTALAQLADLEQAAARKVDREDRALVRERAAQYEAAVDKWVAATTPLIEASVLMDEALGAPLAATLARLHANGGRYSSTAKPFAYLRESLAEALAPICHLDDRYSRAAAKGLHGVKAVGVNLLAEADFEPKK